MEITTQIEQRQEARCGVAHYEIHSSLAIETMVEYMHATVCPLNWTSAFSKNLSI